MSLREQMARAKRDMHDQRRVAEKEGRAPPKLSPEAQRRKARIDAGRHRFALVETDAMRSTILTITQRIDALEDDLFQGSYWNQDEDHWIVGDRLMVAEQADQMMDMLIEIRGMLQTVWNGPADRKAPINVVNEDGTIFGEDETTDE
jgi:hypothetical protein